MLAGQKLLRVPRRAPGRDPELAEARDLRPPRKDVVALCLIASALLRFQDATASADRDAIENAADELITAVTKWVSFSKAHEYRKRLNGVVRRLTSEEPSTKGG